MAPPFFFARLLRFFLKKRVFLYPMPVFTLTSQTAQRFTHMDWIGATKGRNMIPAAIGVFTATILAGSAFAIPEIIPMKNGVTFRHKAHMAATHTCRSCHETGPGKIEGFGKEWAHGYCKGCHGEQNAGPFHCAGCHLKVYD